MTGQDGPGSWTSWTWYTFYYSLISPNEKTNHMRKENFLDHCIVIIFLSFSSIQHFWQSFNIDIIDIWWNLLRQKKMWNFTQFVKTQVKVFFSIMDLVSELFKATINSFHLLLKSPEFNPFTNEIAWREGYLITISQTSQLFLLISIGYSPEVLIIKVLSHYFPQLVQTPQKCILWRTCFNPRKPSNLFLPILWRPRLVYFL